jgi:hypothetical protein
MAKTIGERFGDKIEHYRHHYGEDDWGLVVEPAEGEPPEAMHCSVPTPEQTLEEFPIQCTKLRSSGVLREVSADEEHGPVPWQWRPVS